VRAHYNVHYYKFNLSAWVQSTAHLSLEEEAIYFRLINHYYDTEQPIPEETAQVFRRLRLAACQEKAGQILDEFFTLTARGWEHGKCNQLIAEYQKQAKKNRKNGVKGGRPSKSKASSVSQEKPTGMPDGTQQEPTGNPNYKLETNNQELGTNNQKDNVAGAPLRDWFSQLWDSWPTGYGEKGSRKNAETAFLKIKPDRPLFDLMLRAAQLQGHDKGIKAMAGQFCPNFPHVERWLKNQRWNDEISRSVVTAKLSRQEQTLRAIQQAAGESDNRDLDGSFERIDEDGPAFDGGPGNGKDLDAWPV